jgi:hypothetical protein
VLARDPSIKRLELDSPGGYISEGFKLAAGVDHYGLSTFVDHACSSACAIVFLTGRERVVTNGGKLGFHRAQGFVWDDSRYGDDLGNNRLIDFAESKGVAPEFEKRPIPFQIRLFGFQRRLKCLPPRW